jgi:mono/diheme cytochrome c family protein
LRWSLPSWPAVAAVMLVMSSVSEGHDRETTSVTWNRTVSRIVHQRCGSCHRPEGSAFSLLTYDDARPWAVAIREEILARSMPPWGAVKGFGEFRNDGALSSAQMNLIVNWVEGGVPEGNDSDLPPDPEYADDADSVPDSTELLVRGTTTLEEDFILDGLQPREVPADGSLQITAELPDGAVIPLVWLYEYRTEYGHPFLLKTPLLLPAGSTIRGLPADASLTLLPSVSSLD